MSRASTPKHRPHRNRADKFKGVFYELKVSAGAEPDYVTMAALLQLAIGLVPRRRQLVLAVSQAEAAR